MRLFSKEKNQKFQVFSKKVLRFLSLRYSADFRRSRLVPSPPEAALKGYPKILPVSKLVVSSKLASTQPAGPWCAKRGILSHFLTSIVAKHQKIEKGHFGGKNSESLTIPKNWKEDPFISPGIV